MSATNKTTIICQSDCQFAQNKERRCQLVLIELKQQQEVSPVFNCNQYVASGKMNKYLSEDMERARNAGIYENFQGKLK